MKGRAGRGSSRITVVASFDGVTTARAFAEGMVRYRPWWLRLLLGVRKRGFGRVVSKSREAGAGNRLAFYEVLQETPDQIELSRRAGGYDSSLIVRVEEGRVICQSLAEPKHLMGWAYLAASLPIRWLAVHGSARHAVRLLREEQAP